MHIGASELLSSHFLPCRGADQRGTAEENRARALDDHCFVRHRRNVRTTCGARSHHRRNLRNLARRHHCLVVEDAAEVLAVWKDLGLQRQKCPTRIDEVDAGQVVLQGDLLRAKVLLHRDGEIRSALHRRIVGDDQALALLNAADSGDDARCRRLTLVHLIRRELRELEKWRVWIEQRRDALPCGHLSLLAMAGDVFRPAPLPRLGDPAFELGHQRLHAFAIRAKVVARRVEMSFQWLHA